MGMSGESRDQSQPDERVVCCTLGLLAALVTSDTKLVLPKPPEPTASPKEDEAIPSEPVRNPPQPKARSARTMMCRYCAPLTCANMFRWLNLVHHHLILVHLGALVALQWSKARAIAHCDVYCFLSSSTARRRLSGLSAVSWLLTWRDCLRSYVVSRKLFYGLMPW